MSRARPRVSRGLIAVLILSVGIATVSVLHKTSRSRAASKPTAAVQLASTAAAVESTNAPSGDRPAASVAPQVPLIQTITPTERQPLPFPASASAAAPSQNLAAPATHVSGEPTTAHGAAWARLLENGSTNGAPAGLPPGGSPPAPLPARQPIITGNGPLADGKARIDAGELIDARSVLNGALQTGRLPDADAAAARSLLAGINQAVVFSPRAFPDDAYASSYVVRPRESLAKIAAAFNTTWELLARINNLDPRKVRAGSRIKVIRGPFFAVVDKKAFTMDVYLGALPGDPASMYVTTFRVGLGRDDSTPTGTWAIAPRAKLKHPKYYPPQGGAAIEADDPANPLGGYWIALTGVDGLAVGKKSYGIHGTIDPDSIGRQSSMGCIRLRNEDIALVFDLLVEGKSTVVVKE